MSALHTPGPWAWADVPGAGLQIRGPYKGGTRLLFSDIWRQFPEQAWDQEMIANIRLAAAAPELLEALQQAIEVLADLTVTAAIGAEPSDGQIQKLIKHATPDSPIGKFRDLIAKAGGAA